MVQQIFLPKLREDLIILDQQVNAKKQRRWLLHDVVRNLYFHISSSTVELINLWQAGESLPAFHQRVRASGLEISEEEISQLITFFVSHSLIEITHKAGVDYLLNTQTIAKKNVWSWLLHNYLFIRIPLFKPDRFLERTKHLVEPFFSRTTARLIQLLGLVGLLIVIQQWEAFTHTFDHFFSWQGAFFYLISLIVLKSLHELAHAYTAKRLGCGVPAIGVAFLVLFPVLYTDTSDAWKLNQSRERLQIVFAGIKLELYVAMLATFLWAFLPEGPLKTVAFFMATTSWLTSLMINLNPFLRFDGYFALADWLQEENLQSRSFEMARWRLRELLFGLNQSAPEILQPSRARLMVLYAWITWIYRFVLFLGIALLVYNLAFKALGILLFLVEIIWFILLPIYRELKNWWSARQLFRWNKQTFTTSLLLLILAIWLFIPAQTSYRAHAVLNASEITPIYLTEDARVMSVSINAGQIVKQGDLLMHLESPELTHQLSQIARRLETVTIQLDRQSTSAQMRRILGQQKQQLELEEQRLLMRQNKLIVYAPHDGVISSLISWHPGQTLSKTTELALLRSPNAGRVHAYVEQEYIGQLQPGQTAIWYGQDFKQPALLLTLRAVSPTKVNQFLYPELASVNRGPLPSYSINEGVHLPQQALYQVEFSVQNEQSVPIDWRQMGRVHIEFEKQRPVVKLWRKIWVNLLPEINF